MKREQDPTFLIACLLACGATAWPASAAEPLARPGEWPMWRRDRRATGFQPMRGDIEQPREAWSHYLGGWEALVVVRPAKGTSTLSLGGAKEKNPSYWGDTHHAWGLGDMRFDLAGDGKLVAVHPQHNRKVGKLLPHVRGLQTVEIVQGRLPYGEETNTGVVTCTVHDRGAGKPRKVWQAAAVPKTHRPFVALADVDADGRCEVLLVSDDARLHCIDGHE